MVLRLMLLMLRCLEQGEQRDLEEQVGLQTRSARTHTHTHRHTPATQFPSGPRCHTRPPVDGSDAALLMAACVCACVSVSECVFIRSQPLRSQVQTQGQAELFSAHREA